MRSVVTLQLAGWARRTGVAFCLLAAFGLPATVPLAVLVVVAGGLSTLAPTPGGAGTQQVLLVYALQQTASTAAALSFSVGMQVGITTVNTIIGLTALMFMFRTLRTVAAVRAARQNDLGLGGRASGQRCLEEAAAPPRRRRSAVALDAEADRGRVDLTGSDPASHPASSQDNRSCTVNRTDPGLRFPRRIRSCCCLYRRQCPRTKWKGHSETGGRQGAPMPALTSGEGYRGSAASIPEDCLSCAPGCARWVRLRHF